MLEIQFVEQDVGAGQELPPFTPIATVAIEAGAEWKKTLPCHSGKD